MADSYKVIGRGIEDRKTHEILQLACVGKPSLDLPTEASCSQLQFLYTDVNRVQTLIGSPLEVSHEESSPSLNKQIKSQIKLLRKKAGRDVVGSTAHIFFLTAGAGLGVAVTWTLAGPIGVGLFLIAAKPVFLPSVYDGFAKGLTDLSGFHSEELKNKSVDAWALNAKLTSNKNFQILLAQIKKQSISNEPAGLSIMIDNLGEDEVSDEE